MTPKFLTKEVAEQAVKAALLIMQNPPLKDMFKRQACHIVIIVPEMEVEGREYPNFTIRPCLLLEISIDVGSWSADYKGIAQCKALQLWHGRNDTRTDIRPQLMFPGDAPYWGGVKRHGIVVACSGVQPWLDQMISGMVADICKALAYEAWMKSDDRRNEVEFLA